jgi:phage FluMu gp28-like protein
MKTPIKLARSPMDFLLPYQHRWVNDQSRFKFGLMARQVGKDFCAAAEGIRDCFLAERARTKTTWVIAAPSERQSVEALDKWKEWMKAFKMAIADISEERDDPRNSESLLKSTVITFPGGSRVIAVPGRPETVRGFTGNVVLTEALFFEDFDRTWRAMFPSITNPMRGGLKKVRLLSTPNGVGSKGQQIWAKHYQPQSAVAAFGRTRPTSHPEEETIHDRSTPQPETGRQFSPNPQSAIKNPHSLHSIIWSCHRVDIHDAIREGLQLDAEELRAGLDDPEGWDQEYELNFLDQASVLLPYEVIAPCEDPLATESAPDGFWDASSYGDPVVLGIDFGRKRDLTVCWALQYVDHSRLMTREVLPLDNMSTPEQIQLLRQRIKRADRVCFDYTGAGMGMGDFLVKEFGEYNPTQHHHGKIELCTFTNPLKVEIFSKLRMEFERRKLGVPVSRMIREDIHSVQRVATATGVTYRAPHTGDGHADYATALALAVRAAETREEPFAYSTVYLEDHPEPRLGRQKWILI